VRPAIGKTKGIIPNGFVVTVAAQRMLTG